MRVGDNKAGKEDLETRYDHLVTTNQSSSQFDVVVKAPGYNLEAMKNSTLALGTKPFGWPWSVTLFQPWEGGNGKPLPKILPIKNARLVLAIAKSQQRFKDNNNKPGIIRPAVKSNASALLKDWRQKVNVWIWGHIETLKENAFFLAFVEIDLCHH